MATYASERLSEALQVLEAQAGNASMDSVFNKIWAGSSSTNNQLGMIYLFADVRSEICFARLSQRVRSRAVEKVNSLCSQFQGALNNVNWDGFRSKFSVLTARQAIDDITDLLETAGYPRSVALDREAITDRTAALVVDVESMGLPEEVLSIIKLQLGSINGLINVSANASDEMIARTIKSVVADLLVGLEPYFLEQPKLKEKIIEWGKKSTVATAFSLGLLVDGSSALELIIGKPETPMIAAPEKQITDQTDKGDE